MFSRILVVVPPLIPKPLIKGLIVVCGLVEFCMIAGVVPAYGQRNVLESTPLAARRQYVYSLLGAYVGLANNLQNGVFSTSCDCEFTGGAGAAFTAGIIYEKYTRSELTYGVSVGYEGRGVTSRFQEVEGLMQTSPSTGRLYEVPVSFRNTAQVSLGMLTVMPFVKYHVFKKLWLRAGPGFSLVVNDRITHDKELLTTDVMLPGGERAAVRLQDVEGTSLRLEDARIADLTPFQISANLAAGLDVKVSKTFYLAPVVQYSFPFTTISGRGTNYSIRSVQLLVEGKFLF